MGNVEFGVLCIRIKRNRGTDRFAQPTQIKDLHAVYSLPAKPTIRNHECVPTIHFDIAPDIDLRRGGHG